MAQVTKAQLVEQLESLRVRCERQEALIASLRASLHAPAQVVAPKAAVPNRRYTTARGEVYEIVPEFVGGRTVKTHKFVGLAGAH